MCNVSANKTEHSEYGDCVQISNGVIDLLITVDVGPRIVRYGFVGEDNVFCEVSNLMIDYIQSKKWGAMGGHRLWHTPEKHPRNYIPDEDPVEWKCTEDGLLLSQKVELWSQIKKDMEIKLSPDSTEVTINHTLTNKNAWPIEFGPWACTLMASGGKEIIPLQARDTGVECNRSISLWPFADMNDTRVQWGKKYIQLKQDIKAEKPFKIGVSNEQGWGAYFNNGTLFVKKFTPEIGEKYSDFGATYETFTNNIFLEMETLGPLKLVQPEQSVTHTEKWHLFNNVEMPLNEDDIDNVVKKFI